MLGQIFFVILHDFVNFISYVPFASLSTTEK